MNHILNTIGNTPLIEVEGVYAKLETYNPTGSIKDRMAWYIVKKAEERGELKRGSRVIEATSGNTGIALSMISAIRGYHFTAVMPESMSIERQKMIKVFGGELVLTPAEEDIAGTVKKYEELIRKDPGAWLPRQFENADNYLAHKNGLGQEIIRQMNGRVDAFVAGTGTGGTLIGVAMALKDVNPNVRIVAVEPEESAVISGGDPGLHSIQGIGEGFVPEIVQENIGLVDELVKVKSQDAIGMSERLAKKHGLLVGISSGANILAAMQIRKSYANVVTILPDRGERYLS